MPYHLLTGATGLLGNYLLRNLLDGGNRVAVVVRANARESARRRIESVMTRWEREAGYCLPRPVVLEGDIAREGLGLDRAAVAWVARHCRSVIHNAASLLFRLDARRNEPWQSNLEGTRNVLELCRTAEVRQLHYVSTAFVCGLRTGRVLESELDVGQKMANVYEESKVQAETLVRQADFLDPPTIYRPSVVVGDARTGFTSTFHGFYAPLKAAWTIAERLAPEAIRSRPILDALGLSGQERENFVPVDWVAEAITSIHGRPEHHGRTYHLTSDRPTPVVQVSEVMEEVVREELAAGRGRAGAAPPELANFDENIRDQLAVYETYWREDPTFDRTNTEQAVSGLPCPELDKTVLSRVTRYAIRANFGWPRPPVVAPEFDVADYLAAVLPGDGAGANQEKGLGLQVNGPGGGQWTLALEGGRVASFAMGIAGDVSTCFYLNARTFQLLATRQMSVHRALRNGRLLIENAGADTECLEALFEEAIVPTAELATIES